METVEWIVWGIFAFITISGFFTWLIMKRKYQFGEQYNTDEVLTLISLPRIFFFQAIILVLFLFININKLHLLWIYPLVYFGIMRKWAKILIKREKIEKRDD